MALITYENKDDPGFRAGSPEPSLFAHIIYGPLLFADIIYGPFGSFTQKGEDLASLKGCACVFEEAQTARRPFSQQTAQNFIVWHLPPIYIRAADRQPTPPCCPSGRHTPSRRDSNCWTHPGFLHDLRIGHRNPLRLSARLFLKAESDLNIFYEHLHSISLVYCFDDSNSKMHHAVIHH